ncbi:hypothetical protein [Streptomyces sp. NPDC000410]|uniref:hypothetical protein n=1 Tax=Streptomyces sp. NPDC000410 TaxID=3154254 RepID=UPI00332E4147
MPSTVQTRTAAPLLAAGLLLVALGCESPKQPGASARPGAPASTPRAAPAAIPGLGPEMREQIPEETAQAVVVTGESEDSSQSAVVLYERDPVKGWKSVSAPWPAHNALKGWTDDHWAGDRRSPVGVFGLTDAGGRLEDPGTKLPYHESDEFNAEGNGFLGEPLEGSFDYVVAINYNRESGTSPLDRTRPMGRSRGGGVWIHVDHRGPTQACVSLTLDRMRELLLWLDPGKEPVVVMGDAATLAR